MAGNVPPFDAQAFMAAIINAANAAAANAAPAAVPFALLPGAANSKPLDWAKSEAMKLFNKAVTAIDTKFTLIEDTLRIFIEQVRERSTIYNWDELLTVKDKNGTDRSMLDTYGLVTIEDCQTHANNHVGVAAAAPGAAQVVNAAGVAVQPTAATTRMAQDSMMLYLFPDELT